MNLILKLNFATKFFRITEGSLSTRLNKTYRFSKIYIDHK